MLGGSVGDLVERVERARVHLADLGADDRRRRRPSQRFAQRTRIHPTLRVGGDRLGCAEPEQAEGAVDRDVALAPTSTRTRPAREPVSRHVPAGALEHAEARRGEGGDAAHLRAGDEADRRVAGSPSRSTTHSRTTSSITDAEGPPT